MKLKTKNKIDFSNRIIIEKTQSRVYYKGKLLRTYCHKPIRLNFLTLPYIISLLETSNLKLLEVYDGNALFKNNLNLNIKSKTKTYVIVAKKISS
ncbi:MAG: hypothetical protein QXP52_03305 [Candidatus Aenigmatarchaeota archaeon]